jgi:hypothetical protein
MKNNNKPQPGNLPLSFGAMSEKLSVQLKKTKVKKDELKEFDRLADAVTLLKIQSVITETEAHKARKRIVARIQKSVRKTEGW